MKRIQTPTWSTIEVWRDEAPLSPELVRNLGWVREEVARFEWLPGGARISIGPFVGRLIVPEILGIEVVELVPGTTAALLPLSVGARRLADQRSPVGTTPTDPWLDAVVRFSGLLSIYVQRGIDRRYLQRDIDSSFPRGKIDIRKTLVRHRARGRLDALSCSVRVLSEDSELNRVLLLAAIKGEALLRGTPYTAELRTIRRCFRSFAGVSLQIDVDHDQAREQAYSSARPVTPELIDLSEVLIKGIAAGSSDQQDNQPISIWVNLDSVFEQAVRTLLLGNSDRASVRFGGDDEVPLLRGGERLGAEPDVVVETETSRVLLDAKYRRHGSRIERGELYQLMAHADAYGADEAIIIVPRLSTLDTDRLLGTDSRGCIYRVIVVDANNSARMQRRLSSLFDAGNTIRPPGKDAASPAPA